MAHAALLASGGDFRADVFAEAFWVQAGRQAGGKAAGVLGVGRALESYEVGERLVKSNRGGPSELDTVKKKIKLDKPTAEPPTPFCSSFSKHLWRTLVC